MKVSTTDVMCDEEVCPPPHFHWYPCRNKAKWLVDGRNKSDHPVCGQHVRWYRRYGTNVRPLAEATP